MPQYPNQGKPKGKALRQHPTIGRCPYTDQNEAHEIHRGMGLEVRLSLTFSTIQVTVRFSSEKFPEGTIDGTTTYFHDLELTGREIFSSLCAESHKTTATRLRYIAM
ncbi:hypothetical protein TNCV_1790471 [Trichonephila clavipes]|nr:hypothetical protein TNCV_1790471 [Trichonephila clavipes]